jgi:succinyl-diaminopimelate desuccinylase
VTETQREPRVVDRFADEPELGEGPLAATLTALVSAPSVNPGMSEAHVVETVRNLLEGTGCATTTVEFAPGRPSLAAVIEGAADGPRLVLNGHVDTVAVDDRERWTVDPFGGELRDGAIWGRGSLDMKGGLTAQIACARVLAKHRGDLLGSLVLHFAAGEECGEPGTKVLLEHGFTGDWGITTEPTNLTVATAQRGVCWSRVRIEGRSAHASRPDAGLDPSVPLAALLQALNRYGGTLTSRQHPLLGSPTCVVTVVRSGVQHNAIADYAEITIDRRMLPGETAAGVRQELEAVVAAAVPPSGGYTCTLEPLHNHFEPAQVSPDSPFVATLQRVRDDITGTTAPITGTAYGSDVRNLILDAGMEAVTFGPGDSTYCHCTDEHLHLSDLRTAALALTAVAYELLT